MEIEYETTEGGSTEGGSTEGGSTEGGSTTEPETPVAATTTFRPVTSTSELKAGGEYVIAYTTGKTAIAKSQSGSYLVGSAITVNDDGTIEVGDDVQVFTLNAGTVDGKWTWITSDPTGIYLKSSGTDSKFTTSPSDTNVSFDNGNVQIYEASQTDRWLQYNTSALRFAHYAKGQSAVQLYVKGAALIASGLEWNETDAYTTIDYKANDDFAAPTLVNPQNIAVTYTSSNTDVATIADDGTVTLGTSAGSTTITVAPADTDTYTGSATYTVTVNEQPTLYAPIFQCSDVMNEGESVRIRATGTNKLKATVNGTEITSFILTEGGYSNDMYYRITSDDQGKTLEFQAVAYEVGGKNGQVLYESDIVTQTVKVTRDDVVETPEFYLTPFVADNYSYIYTDAVSLNDGEKVWPGYIIQAKSVSSNSYIYGTISVNGTQVATWDGEYKVPNYTLSTDLQPGDVVTVTCYAASGSIHSEEATIQVTINELTDQMFFMRGDERVTNDMEVSPGDVIQPYNETVCQVIKNADDTNVNMYWTVDGEAQERSSFEIITSYTIPDTAVPGERFVFSGYAYIANQKTLVETVSVVVVTDALTYNWVYGSADDPSGSGKQEFTLALEDATTSKSIDWAVSSSGTSFSKQSSLSAYQIGTNKTPVTAISLTSSAFVGYSISKVVVTNWVGKDKSANVSVAIGGEPVGDAQAVPIGSGGTNTFDCDGQLQGELEISWSNMTGYLALSGIQVKYQRVAVAPVITTQIADGYIYVYGLSKKETLLYRIISTEDAVATQHFALAANMDSYQDAAESSDWIYDDATWIYDASSLGESQVLLVKGVGVTGLESNVLDFELVDGEVCTSVRELTAPHSAASSDAVYDLLGRRVDAPAAPGIYIVAGRKLRL